MAEPINLPAAEAQPTPPDYCCQVCGRQDESLRIAVYPFVFSLAVVTFRRAFSGLWCGRHRLRYQGLAGMVSASLGWFGIPYGFIFTPLTLWKLAKGGDLPADPNQAMLRTLADQKLRRGDREGGLRCLEAALSLGDDSFARAELAARAGFDLSRFSAPAARTALRLAAALGAALGLGLAVGAIDYFVAWLYSSLSSQEIPFLLAVATWVPLVALAATAGIGVIRVLEWALGSSRMASHSLGLGLALSAAGLASYGMTLGRAAGDLVAYVLSGNLNLPLPQALSVAAQTLTLGGVWLVRGAMESGETSGIIYLAIVAASAVYLLLGSLGAARRSVGWQRRVGAALPGWRPASAWPGWAALAGTAVLGAAVVGLASVPPALLTTTPEAYEHGQAAAQLLDAVQAEAAIAEYEQALRLEPASVEYLTGLAVAHMSVGQMQQAREPLAEALRLAPTDPIANFVQAALDYASGDLLAAERELGIVLGLAPFPEAHFFLGSLRSQLGDSEAALAHYGEAIRLNPDYADAQVSLALVRLGRGEFEMAASLAQDYLRAHPESAEAQAVLSMAQRRMGQIDQAAESLRTAESLASGSADVQAVAYAFMDLNQFEQAEAYQLQAGADIAWAGNQHLLLAAIYTSQGSLDQATDSIEQATALGADPVAVLERRADLLVERQDLAGARTALTDAAGSTPERWSVHAGLARVYLYQGQAQDAAQEARAALALAPFEAGVHTILALALLDLEQTDEAQAEAQEAIRLDPMRDLSHYALGSSHQALGQVEQARAEYERFLELYWDRAYVREYRSEVERYLADTAELGS
jgi:tetratricopeptide (TPR) repeat protein